MASGSEIPRFPTQVTYIDGFHGGYGPDEQSIYDDDISDDDEESDVESADDYDASGDGNSRES